MQSLWDCFKWIVLLPRIKNLFLFLFFLQKLKFISERCNFASNQRHRVFVCFFFNFFQLFFASTFLSAHLHRFRKLPSRWKRKTRFVENKSLEHFYFGHFSSKFFKINSISRFKVYSFDVEYLGKSNELDEVAWNENCGN